jgi:hypothetical protein
MGLHIDEIISQLLDLAKKHKATGDNIDDFIDSELIELEAEHLIIDYCENKGLLVNGFPREKKQWPEEDLEEDYFCRERYQLYLDTLATQHEDVAELMWAYVSSFWKNQFEGKDEYLQSIKYNLDSGDFYDLTI